MHNAPTLSPEGRARCIAWRCGFVLERDAAGIQIRYPGDGVVAARVPSFEDVPAAFVAGKLVREVRL